MICRKSTLVIYPHAKLGVVYCFAFTLYKIKLPHSFLQLNLVDITAVLLWPITRAITLQKNWYSWYTLVFL